MPQLPPARLVDSAWESPHATAKRFVLGGDEWLAVEGEQHSAPAGVLAAALRDFAR
jgi:hypothetical protein